jgi:hypothetical protein
MFHPHLHETTMKVKLIQARVSIYDASCKLTNGCVVSANKFNLFLYPLLNFTPRDPILRCLVSFVRRDRNHLIT